MSGDRLLKPGQVAKIFNVNARTVSRWAVAGKLPSITTPGGHHRFLESAIRSRLALQLAQQQAAQEAAAQEQATEPPAIEVPERAEPDAVDEITALIDGYVQ